MTEGWRKNILYYNKRCETSALTFIYSRDNSNKLLISLNDFQISRKIFCFSTLWIQRLVCHFVLFGFDSTWSSFFTSGAITGLKFFFTPQWEKLASLQVLKNIFSKNNWTENFFIAKGLVRGRNSVIFLTKCWIRNPDDLQFLQQIQTQN